MISTDKQGYNAVEKIQILNSYFDCVTAQETVDWAMETIRSGKRTYISTVNVAILMMMRSHLRLRRFIENASLCVADGKPIVWLSHWLGTPLPERVTGIDLIDLIAERAEIEGFGIYLIGSTEELVRAAAQSLLTKYPSLKIDYSDGYFPLDKPDQKIRDINSSDAHILFVGMGVPRQEIFIEENLSHLNVNLAIGVGGSFDVLAGFKKRAPKYVQDVGLEWFYRLMQEPGRLGKRYLMTNVKFIYEVSKIFILRQPNTLS